MNPDHYASSSLTYLIMTEHAQQAINALLGFRKKVVPEGHRETLRTGVQFLEELTHVAEGKDSKNVLAEIWKDWKESPRIEDLRSYAAKLESWLAKDEKPERKQLEQIRGVFESARRVATAYRERIL